MDDEQIERVIALVNELSSRVGSPEPIERTNQIIQEFSEVRGIQHEQVALDVHVVFTTVAETTIRLGLDPQSEVAGLTPEQAASRVLKGMTGGRLQESPEQTLRWIAALNTLPGVSTSQSKPGEQGTS